MWIFSTLGAFSAVCARKGDGSLANPPDPDRMMVRARDKDHLEALQDRFPFLRRYKLLESPHNDYRFRLFCPKSVWTRVMAGLVADQDYDNFKNSCAAAKASEGYLHALHTTWGVMYRMQTDKYGPGIYDAPKPKKKKRSKKKVKPLPGARVDANLFHEDDDFDEDDGGPLPDYNEWIEPKDKDEVLCVVDGSLAMLGIIINPDAYTSNEDAYSAAVMAGALRLVGVGNALVQAANREWQL